MFSINLNYKSMSKILSLAVAFFTLAVANAQIEAKINPIGAVSGKPDVSAEYIVSDNFGVELSVGVAFGKVAGVSYEGSEKPTQSGFGVKLAGKYYFSPDEGGDGWYGDLYLRQESLKVSYPSAYDNLNYKSSILAGGVEFGKKWLFDSGFLIDIAVGVGRPFSEKREFTDAEGSYGNFEIGFDATGKFAIGYRF